MANDAIKRFWFLYGFSNRQSKFGDILVAKSFFRPLTLTLSPRWGISANLREGVIF